MARSRAKSQQPARSESQRCERGPTGAAVLLVIADSSVPLRESDPTRKMPDGVVLRGSASGDATATIAVLGGGPASAPAAVLARPP